MKKIILLGSLCISTAVFAATANNSESVNQCMQYKQQMMKNHQAIDAAYHKNDACTMGKLMIQNRQMFESHPECFPRMAKMKGTPTTQQSATTK
jgi:hypothetical protein